MPDLGAPVEGTSSETAHGETGPGDEAVVVVSRSRIYRDFFGAAVASVEERIFLADVIARAKLVSASDGVLRFRAVEYLKGTGADEFSVAASTEGRDSQWDELEAVLFLSLPESGSQKASSEGSLFEFADTTAFDYQPFNDIAATSYAGNLPEGYTVDSRNPVWLPLDPATGTGTGDASGWASRFVTASAPLYGAASTTISLADLRSKIAWMDGGEGSVGYDKCIRASLDHMRYFRDWEAYHGRANWLSQANSWIASGASRGEEVNTFEFERDFLPAYSNVWLSGPDSGLFRAQVVDDDEDPTNGFTTNVTTARPLPAGTYRVIERSQWYLYQPCNFIPRNGLDWTVTATAPDGAVHEALFDPADLSPGTGFSAAAGVLGPADYSFGGAATTITGLKWEAGSVVLTLSPYVSLAGEVVDFIGLDGTVWPRLTVAEAKADIVAGTLTWRLISQPWEAGDALMLRIRYLSLAEMDRDILAVFHRAAGGPGWSDDANWLSDRPLHEWHGVAVDADGRVVELILSDNGLTGEIPSSLGRLSALRELRLSDNELTGGIPAELGRLSELRELWLGGNRLTGVIPAELGGLSELRDLGLGGNRLTGEVPRELWGLSHLRNLYLQDNLLRGIVDVGAFDRLAIENFAFGDNPALCAYDVYGWDRDPHRWRGRIPNDDLQAGVDPLGPTCKWDSGRQVGIRGALPRRRRGQLDVEHELVER